MSIQNLKFVQEYLEDKFIYEVERGACRVFLDSDYDKTSPAFVTLDRFGDEHYFGENLPKDISEEELIQHIENRLKC